MARHATTVRDPATTRRRRFRTPSAALPLVLLLAPACSEDTPDEPRGAADDAAKRAPDTGRRQRPHRSDGRSDALGRLPDEVGGWHVTRGAAPGYVADRACKECHEPIWESYQSVGMSRSFYPLTAAVEVEDFGKAFFQKTTGNYYSMTKRDGKYYQSRWRQDAKGNRYAEYERSVKWVIGSGNHVRTYFAQTRFAQTRLGELYEMPLSWYAEGGWHMSPGYEQKGHFRFERLVQRECMFCHNAYPEVPVGNDAPAALPAFPQELPHGIGCQRCHGPGARHIEIALRENAEKDAVRASVLNPANFTQQGREELCMTCHMQPDVGQGMDSVVHRFGRRTYSHRPDQGLFDHILFLDCGSEERRESKLEINHHAYRLRKSRCYTHSPGKLDCLTCHDPHRKVPKRDRPAYYREKCAKCHEPSECRAPGMGTAIDPMQADCVACHMVRARPGDVVHATITDHKIRRKPPARNLTAARPDPALPNTASITVIRAFPERAPRGTLLDIHRDLARGPRVRTDQGAGLVAAIRKADPAFPAAYVKTGRMLALSHLHRAALEILQIGAQKFPDDADVLWNLAVSLHKTGQHAQALEAVDRSLAIRKHPRALHLRGNVLAHLGRPTEAARAFEESLALQPSSSAAWLQYGQLLAGTGRGDDAIVALRKAIARNPDAGEAYVLLADLLSARSKVEEAIGMLEQAAPLVTDAALELVGIYLFIDMRLRNPGRAMELAVIAAKREPDNGRTHLHLAFAGTLLDRMQPVSSALRRARELGADPACCTGIELLAAIKRRDTAAVNRLGPRLRKDLTRPTQERLRRHVVGVLQGMTRGR